MTQQVVFEGKLLSSWERAFVALLGLALLGVWGVAGWLEPDPRGFGTHERLGLPPCSFKQLTGRPCPSCGMTTAFVYLARADVFSSLRVNPGGFLVGLVSILAVPWSFLSAQKGRLIGVAALDRAVLALMLPIIAVSVVVWLLRLILG